MLSRWGRVCTRRPWVVITVWVLIVGAIVAAVAMLGRPTDNAISLPGSGTQRAADLQSAAFSGESSASGTSGTLVLRADGGGTLESAAARTALAETARRIDAVPHVTAVTPATRQSGTISSDGRTGLLTVTVDLRPRDVDRALVAEIEEAAEPARSAGVETVPGGLLAQAADRGDTRTSELIGLGVAVVVLLVAFGSAVAAGLPIVIALVTVVCGIGGIGLLGHLVAVPSVAATLGTMIGMGVGIDYALFILSRYRILLAEGGPAPDAVRQAVSSSGASVMFAGGTVVIALSGLALSGVPVLRTMAWTSGLVVVGAVFTAVTLLPALLTVLGHRIDAFRVIRRRGASAAGLPSAGWARVGEWVTARPWRVLVGALLLLGVLAAPAAALTLGQVDDASAAPGSAAARSYDLLSEGFGPGANGPLTVVAELDGGKATAASDPRIAALSTALGKTRGVAAVAPARLSDDSEVAVLRVTPATAPSDPATAATVDRIRRLDVDRTRVHVGGPVAARADLADRVGTRMPYVIIAVLGLCTLVLLPAFRAPVVAIKAAVMNLISICAAYGVLTAVFSWGWGVELLGLDGPVPIEAYVPMMLFAVLFGLSMDYEVFLLTAVREEWLRHADNRRAVAAGLASTGRVITSAALIMVSVFASFLLDTDPVIKMFGLGLAAAVVVDATVVRGLLVPATMVLLGKANWWRPTSLPILKSWTFRYAGRRR